MHTLGMFYSTSVTRNWTCDCSLICSFGLGPSDVSIRLQALIVFLPGVDGPASQHALGVSQACTRLGGMHQVLVRKVHLVRVESETLCYPVSLRD